MNEKKICFIICSSSQLYTEECLYYIGHLNVPEGYQLDVFTVEGAESMTAGYNEGMQASDAKYKVYLHQDTFIVNLNFIEDVVSIFQKDEQIGMIGMIGSPKLPESGIMWEGERCGAIYVPAYNKEPLFRAGNSDLTEVEAIDGLLMVTQYDIPWREDLFDKWDFYDCSQSQEFLKRGYKVVVPELKEPWCLHDSTISYLTSYDEERVKFLREYFREREGVSAREYKITVIVTSFNRRQQLQDTLEWLSDVEGIFNIIVVDNGSSDGTADWLSSQEYEYIWFDEGVQGYGKLWNTALQNFEIEDYVLFMEAGVFPEKKCLLELVRTLQKAELGAANPVTNSYGDGGDGINSKEFLETFVQKDWDSQSLNRFNRNAFRKTLSFNWRIWATRKDVLREVGLFREKLKSPVDVLTDYSLRMIQSNFRQSLCFHACAYEDLGHDDKICTEKEQWQCNDRAFMKAVWGMNYFNLSPNRVLVEYIHEPVEKEFKVLEVGCDLGATLFEIQECFPNCQTYGIDINRAAVDIAKHITKAEYGNIDELNVPFQEKFDYIIFGDVLEHLRHPEEVIKMCRDMLNENGYIIASIPNVMHISVIEELIEGRFRYSDVGLLDRTHIHFFTYYEIMNLFQEAGYVVRDINRTVFDISERERIIMELLLRLSDQTESWMYETFQYIIKAQKQ